MLDNVSDRLVLKRGFAQVDTGNLNDQSIATAIAVANLLMNPSGSQQRHLRRMITKNLVRATGSRSDAEAQLTKRLRNAQKGHA